MPNSNLLPPGLTEMLTENKSTWLLTLLKENEEKTMCFVEREKDHPFHS